MTKYFTIPTIRSALENLQTVDSKWLIIPLVFAANGVTSTNKVECTRVKGTGKFLKQFFDGQLMGLEPREHGGKCNIRPGNPDPRRTNDKLITVDYSDLWGKTYSQSGYGDWQDGRILMHKSPEDRGTFQLGPNFPSEFRSKIDSSFKFEFYLVWLYAFRGMPDTVSSWAELRDDFISNFTAIGIPSEYEVVFSLSGDVPWPTDLTLIRPTDEELQLALVPERVTASIPPALLLELRDTLQSLIRREYLELTDDEVKGLAISVVSGLQSCRRLFLYGDPGTGKTELARLIGTAYETVFGSDRVHVVYVSVADSTTTDKLVGFSTLDGSWVSGILTQPSGNPKKELLYDETEVPGRRQINIVVLDEANRRDIEELLVKFQAALDSESADPDHDDFRIALDNAGERRMSPNSFLIMTGNSPREDSGRMVQSRPFKRRHNLLPVENVFRRVLAKDQADFIKTLVELWAKVGPALCMDQAQRDSFVAALNSATHADLLGHSKTLLEVLDSHAVGVSFGLMKKVLKTAGMRFALTDDFEDSLNYGFTEAVFPLLSAEDPVDGKSVKDSLDELLPACQSALPVFFETAQKLLRGPDTLGRVRPFL